MSAEAGVLIGLMLAVLAAFFVARPLIRPDSAVANDESAITDLLARREAAYQILRDLDSDFQSEKLAEDDYRQMRVQALAQAAEVVAQLDNYQEVEPVPPGSTGRPGAASRSRKTSRAAQAGFCPKCGTPHQPDDDFCRKCGQALH